MSCDYHTRIAYEKHLEWRLEWRTQNISRFSSSLSCFRDNESPRRRRTWRNERLVPFSTRVLHSTFQPPKAQDKISMACPLSWCCSTGIVSPRMKWLDVSNLDQMALEQHWITGKKFAIHHDDKSLIGINCASKFCWFEQDFSRTLFFCWVVTVTHFSPPIHINIHTLMMFQKLFIMKTEIKNERNVEKTVWA